MTVPHQIDRRSVDPQRYAQQLERHRTGEAQRLRAMRADLRRGASLLGALLLMALLLHTSAVAQQKAEIKISRIAGTVEVLHAKQTKGKWQAAKKGQAIVSGWKLRTGDDGKVQLVFPLDNTVIVKSNSVLTVDKLDLGGGAETTVDAGSLLADLKTALSPGSEFEIKTPSALATVRGTQFAVLLGEPEDEGNRTTVPKQTQGTTFGEKVNQGMQSAGGAKQTQGSTFGEKVNQGMQSAAGREAGGSSGYTMEFIVLEGASLPGGKRFGIGGETAPDSPLGSTAGKGLSEVRDFSSIDNAPEEKERGSMSGAQSNPLYQDKGNSGVNPLYEGQNRQGSGGTASPLYDDQGREVSNPIFSPAEIFGTAEEHPLWVPAEAMGDGSVRLGDGSVFPNCISIDEPGTGKAKGGQGQAVFVADINGELVMMMVSPEGPGGGGSGGGAGGNPSAHIINGPCVGGSGPVPVPTPYGPSGSGGSTVIDGGGGGGGGGIPTATGDEAGTLSGLGTGTASGGGGGGVSVKFPGGGRLVLPGLRNEAADMEFWDDELGRWVSGGPGLGALLGGGHGEEAAKVGRNILKEYFEKGDKPTQQQFAAFIDSLVHVADDRGLLGLMEFNPAQDYSPGDSADQASRKGYQYYMAQSDMASTAMHNNPLAGNDDWNVGDWVIHNGSDWGKIDNTDDRSDGNALKKEEGGRHTPFHNKYKPSARLYGYEGTVAVENELGSQALTQGKTVNAAAGEAPSPPVDSGPEAEAFRLDALDTSDFEMQEALDSADTRLQQIADKLLALEGKIDEFEKQDGGRAQYNPKEIAIDKNVPWKSGTDGGTEGGGEGDAAGVQYNPKEIGIDKSVPWGKGSARSADGGGGGGGAAELTGRPVGQPAAAGLGSHVQREPKWVAGVRAEIRVLEDEYMEVLTEFADAVRTAREKGSGMATGRRSFEPLSGGGGGGGGEAGIFRPHDPQSGKPTGQRGSEPIAMDLDGDGVEELVLPISDANGDGELNGSDYELWRGNYGSGGGAAAGDPDQDGTITGSDVVIYAVLGGLKLGTANGGVERPGSGSERGAQTGAPKKSFGQKLGGFAKGVVLVEDEDGSLFEADAFSLGDLDGDGTEELLLPAVQKVREAAARSSSGGGGAGKASFKDFSAVPDSELIGLLLPAVQKVREAAAVPDENGEFTIAEATDEILIGLLLPAVQKVRAAASSSGGGGGAGKVSFSDLSFISDEEMAALLLPAVQKIREAAARSNASGGGGGAGKATFKEFTITKKTDSSAVDESVADLAATGDDATAALLLPAIQKVREAAARASSGKSPTAYAHYPRSRMFGADTDGDGLGDEFSGRVVIPVVPAGRPEAGPPIAMLLLSGGDGGKLTKADAGRSASAMSNGELALKMSDPDAVSLLDASINMLAKGGKKGDKLSLVGFGSFSTSKEASDAEEGGGGAGGMQVMLLEADIDGDGRAEPIGSIASTTRAAGGPGQRPHTQGHVQVGGAALTIVGDPDGDGDYEEIDIDLSGGGGGSGGSFKEVPKVKIGDGPNLGTIPTATGDDAGTMTGGGSSNFPPGVPLPSTVISGTGTTIPRPLPCKGCRMVGGGTVIGDLDGDGSPDAMVADLDGDGIGEDMLLLPDGGGMVADLDGDGMPDLILSGAVLKQKSDAAQAALRNGVATGAGAAAGLTSGGDGSGGQAVLPRDVLKSYFETGDIPTQDDFANLIDSFLAPGAGGGQVIIEADTDGDGEWEPIGGIAIGDVDGDGTTDYMVSTARERGSGMATGRRNQESDNQDIARKMIPITQPELSGGERITSPRDHQSGLPTGKRMRLTLDFSGDGIGLEYEVSVLGDIDGDGLDDYALDKNTQFDIELTVGKGRGMETADEGSSTPSGGADEYKDGDDPVTHKRAGKAKYKNIVLKRGQASDNSEQDIELGWAEADLDGDGESEQLLLSDSGGAFDPDKWSKLYQTGKVIVRGWDPKKKEEIVGEVDSLIWSPRSNIAAADARQEFGQVQTQKKRCSIVLPTGDVDGDGLEDMIAFGDPPGGQGTSAKGGKEVDKLKEEIKKLTKKESQGTALLDDSAGGGQGDEAAAEMRAEQTKLMTRKEKIRAGFVDTDGDGALDCVDPDDDGDGIDELLLGDLDGDGVGETGIAVGDIDGDGVGDFMVLGGNKGINETLPDTAMGRKILDRGEAGDNVALGLRSRHETAKNAIGNIRGMVAGDDGSGGGAGGSEGFFKSVGGLEMETEVMEFAEGGLSGGKEVDTAWESVSGGDMVIEHTETTIGSDKFATSGAAAGGGGVYVASGDLDGDGAAETVASLSLSADLEASLSGAGEIIIEADTDGDGEWEPIGSLMVGAVLSGGAGGEFDVYSPDSGADQQQQKKKAVKFKAGAELAGSVNKRSSSGGGAGGGVEENKVEHWGDPHENLNGRIIEADLDGDGEWEPLDSVIIEADVTGDGVDDPLVGVGIGDVDGDGSPDFSVKLINPIAMDKGLRVDGGEESARQLGKPKYDDMKTGAQPGAADAEVQDLAVVTDEEAIALLLPAVQKIREAASRSGSGADRGSFALPEVDDEVLIGLLLPAVQKVREAAARGSGGGAGKASMQDLSLLSDEEVAALLLPAVQKIREAAARVISPMAGGGRGFYSIPEVDDEVLIGLLLPAVQKIREAAARSSSGPDYFVKKHIGNVKYEDISIIGDEDGDGEVDGLYASAGDTPTLRIKLKDVMVSSYQTGGHASAGGTDPEPGLSSGQPQIVENKKGLAGLTILGEEDLDGDGVLDTLIGGDLDGDGSDDLLAYWPHMHQKATDKREARVGRNPQTGKEIKIAAKSVAMGGLDLTPPDGTSDETRAFKARLTDFLGRPSSSALKGDPDLHTTAHEAAHVVQQRGMAPGGNRLWPQQGYRTTGATDGGGWDQTSALAQFDADKIAELYDRLKGGVGQAGDAYEQHADAVAGFLDEAEALVRAGLELQALQGENILSELELLRRHHELCGQTEHLRRRVEVLKSNKQGDPNANRGDSPTLEFTSADGRALSFELFFDTYEEGTAGEELLEWIGALRAYDGSHRLTRGTNSRSSAGGSSAGDVVKDTPREAGPSFGDDSASGGGWTGDPIDSSGDVRNLDGAEGGSDSVWIDLSYELVRSVDETCQRAYRTRTGNLIILDDKVEMLIPPVQKINEDIEKTLEQARLMEEEWQRYEAANQTSQMQLLYMQFLQLEKSVLPEVDDEVLLYGQYDAVVGDDCDDDCDGLDELLRPQGLPYDDYESLHRRELGDLLRRAIGPDMEPDLATLIPRTMDSLADLQQAAEQWEELVRILNKVAEDGEPIIGDVEELEDKLTGLLPPGDNPHFEPRLGLSDSDGDGLGDVTELDLGTDPTDPNDGGFIPLISPDDDDSVLFPETQELTFEFEKLESDKIEQYILVLEAEGRIFAIQDADDTEEIQLEQIAGPEGVLAEAIDANGELHIEWHVEAQLDQSSNVGLPPGAFPNTVSSERRRLTIITPVQTEDIILDLSLESPTPIQPKSQLQVRGTISQVDALGRWEIRLAYDPSLLRFVRGERLGLFTSSTVFFGDQPGGILVISGTAPAGSSGLSGDGAIFDLFFEALDFGEGSIEGDSLDLFNIIDVRQQADFGEIVDYVIERVATGASSNGANPNGAPPGGTPGKPGRGRGK